MSDDRLGRLNDAERAVLRLLAEGHTAKSAATALDSSEPAVNERLREARRKTGFGSSRELARAVVAQENRDREIGGAVPGGAGQAKASPRRFRGVVTIGALTMSLLLTAALFVLQSDAVPSAPAPDVADPLVAGLIPRDDPSPPQLHRRLREEARDAAWAPQSETALAARYRRINGVGGADQVLRVTCATSLCEIVGTLASDAATARTIEDLQSTTLSAALRADGFDTQMFTIGTTGGSPTFIAYVERIRPA